ncbi:hypothetical protein ILYODFUR_035144 [Ilyodon furcidens]|uniref:Secreted protein n=1 Tax=Ilyodon furcidens TaxID=33524 RepID=A0ABV0TT58_9TELE
MWWKAGCSGVAWSIASLWSLCCVGVASSGFQGSSSPVGVCHCGEGIHTIWVQGHVFDICVVVEGGPVGEIHVEGHGVEIRIHWVVGIVSSCGGSGWWTRLHRVEPSFVHGPLFR